ncbi:osmotic-shock protein [alpha proteobacterium AAP81b]|nr:osmotic-shock protein [alpha proteobacterium AAP81b]
MNTLQVLLDIFHIVCGLLIYGLVGWTILSWLVAFNVVNLHNRFVRSLVDGLDRLFAPMLRPIRRILPDMGGIDLSPMVLVLLIMLVDRGIPALLRDFGVIPAYIGGA